MLSPFDYAVVGVYLIFLASLGWFYRRFGHDSSEYFRGGGEMPWWLVGASTFMASFSAWTFTGAAGLAYRYGLVVVVIFLANAAGFLLNWRGSAALFRQTRVISPLEAVRARLGRGNEQFFTWMGVPMAILGGGIWLYGLAIFCAPMFGLDLRVTILAGGAVVVLIAAMGGSWAVAAGDFLQALMLLPITLVAAVYALGLVDGVSGLVAKLPATSLDLSASQVEGFGAWWVAAVVLEKIVGMNSLVQANRYLPVADGRQAGRSALLAALLFLGGSLIWFIPPLAARALGIDLARLYPGLAQPSEAAYVAMVRQCLPVGLMGLMVTGIIGTTLSAMDTGLNRNAAIFIRSFYLPVLRPRASERELVLAGRLVTLGFGAVIILLALYYTTWKETGVFSLMFRLSAMLGTPYVIPLFWCFWVRRGPDWAGWSTVLFCLGLSAAIDLLPSWPPAGSAAALLGVESFLAFIPRHQFMVMTLANFAAGSAWYLGCAALSPRPASPARRNEIAAFFEVTRTPIRPDEVGDPEAATAQARRLGKLAMAYGGFVALLLLIPNDARGRGAILFCAVFLGAAGGLLSRLRSRSAVSPAGKENAQRVPASPLEESL